MLDRRGFLKLGGATAFAALFGGCEKVSKTLVPFVVPPDDHVLGEALWYASGCRQCPAGCGIVVRVSEGRAKKIEGNPLHPVNAGRLCARGQAALQALYHPERLGRPLRLDGPRGSGRFREIPWEEALALLMANLKKVREEAPASLLLLSDPMRGHAGLVAGRFMKAFGSPQRVAWDPFGPDALLKANEAVFGVRDLPEIDLAGARYLLSFSGDFLETGVSPVHYARGFGRMRRERETVRGKFVHFGPRLSMTAASADLFHPVAPGTEGTVALGIAHVLVKEGLVPRAAEAGPLWEAGLSAFTPEHVAQATGASSTIVPEVAREFARNQPGVALSGFAAATGVNGTHAQTCVALLNALADNVGKPGGLSFPDRSAAFARYGAEARLLAPPPGSGYAAVREAIGRMAAGEVRMALLAGASNPAFTLPPPLKFAEALGKVPFVAAFAPFVDETSALADLVLPTPTFLEAWGDDLAPAGHGGEAVTLFQPVVEPFRDTRPMEDVLIAAAKELGGELAKALPWSSFRECLEQAHGGPGGRMEEALRQGVALRRAPGARRPVRPTLPAFPKPAAADFGGEPGKYPLVLHLFPSIALYDGRGANLPWLQELPDPVSTAVWRNWVEVHPATAAKLGLADGDGVAVSSPFGTIRAFVSFHPGLAPGAAAMPLGQGHDRYGKVAAGRGDNPLALLPAVEEAGAKGPAWQCVRVSLRKEAVPGRLVRTGHPEGQWKPGNVM